MRSQRGGRGTVTVEMALVLPLLLLILVGSLELGTIFSSYLRFQNAVREGSRLAALGVSEAEITARVFQFAPGLDPVKMTLTVTNAEGDRGDPVKVDAAYTYDVSTMLMAIIIGDPDLTMNYQTTMRLE